MTIQMLTAKDVKVGDAIGAHVVTKLTSKDGEIRIYCAKPDGSGEWVSQVPPGELVQVDRP